MLKGDDEGEDNDDELGSEEEKEGEEKGDETCLNRSCGGGIEETASLDSV